ncbi:MAG: FliH/SctL family protein [Deltaproteobacteria bacterium]|nr:FliH/SctL family protein [Deltaproteobacteria bacterium]
MVSGNIEAFRFPVIEGDTGLSRPDADGFILQAFDGNVPSRTFLSEKELISMSERILAEAEEKRQHIEQTAYEEGFRQGQKDGQEVGRRGLEEVIQRFETLLDALVREKEVLYHQREHDLVELVRLIARKVVGRELTLHPEAIRDLVACGFETLFQAEQITLLVHPQDYELLIHDSKESWPPGLSLVSDSSVCPGGFRLETEQGGLDGTLEGRWARVDQAIDEILGKADADGAA